MSTEMCPMLSHNVHLLQNIVLTENYDYIKVNVERQIYFYTVHDF